MTDAAATVERPDERRAERSRGRFTKGNRAAAGRRPRRRTAADLAALVDRRLQAASAGDTLEGLVVDAVIAVARAGAGGDVRAAQWLADRLFPVDGDAIALPGLPSPAKRPAAYLDALAGAVSRGELSPAKAASLSQLPRGFLADETLRALVAELEALKAMVAALDRRAAHEPEAAPCAVN